MTRFIKRLHQFNKGFTLVELIIAIALLSIVGTAVVALMSTGTNQYRTQSVQVALQRETQALQTQLRDYLGDANWYVTFAGDSNAVPCNRVRDKGGIPADAILVILNRSMDYSSDTKASEKKIEINAKLMAYFKSGNDTGDIYYTEFTDKFNNDLSVEDLLKELFPAGFDNDDPEAKKARFNSITHVESEWSLLAENVSRFYVNVNELADPTDQDKGYLVNENHRVDAEVTIQIGERSYDADFAVALRNKVYPGEELAQAQGGLGSATTSRVDSGVTQYDAEKENASAVNPIATQTGTTRDIVICDPDDPKQTLIRAKTLGKGGSFTFKSVVKGRGVVSQDVIWLITEDTDALGNVNKTTAPGTGLSQNGDTCTLTIDGNETLKKLTLVATTASGKKHSRKVNIYIDEITGVKLSVSNMSEDWRSVIPGQSITLAARTEGGQTNNSFDGYAWSMRTNNGTFDASPYLKVSSDKRTATLTIPNDLENGDTVDVNVSIVGLLGANGQLMNSHRTFTVSSLEDTTNEEIINSLEVVKANTGISFKRGDYTDLQYTFMGVKNNPNVSVAWTITDMGGLPEGALTILNGNRLWNENAATIRYDRSYTIRLRADATYVTNGNTYTYSQPMTLTIPAVKVKIDAGYQTNSVKTGGNTVQTLDIPFTVEGIDASKLSLFVTTTPSSSALSASFSAENDRVHVEIGSKCPAKIYKIRIGVNESSSSGTEFSISVTK